MNDPRKIQQSIRFAEAQWRVMDEADRQPDLLQSPGNEDARRRELEKDLALRGGFADKRLVDLVLQRLGARALTDEALALLDELLHVLTRDGDDDGQA